MFSRPITSVDRSATAFIILKICRYVHDCVQWVFAEKCDYGGSICNWRHSCLCVDLRTLRNKAWTIVNNDEDCFHCFQSYTLKLPRVQSNDFFLV